jgi:ABC-type multidrug transport system fused ATPase/permease subunit
MQDHFIRRFCEIIYRNHQAEYHQIGLRWWYFLYNSVVNSMVIGSIALGGLFLIRGDILSTSMAGLALTYSLLFVNAIPRIVRNIGEVQNQMTSVERLEHYTQLPPEKQASSCEPSLTKTNRPSGGKIEFQHVESRYHDSLPPTLKGLNFTVNPRETIGIVGRTGSGKSTVFQALYRLIPLEKGKIRIDGVDISDIPLPTLRKKIAIVPQDPFIFAGTVKENIDPENRRHRREIKEKLSGFQLWEFIESLPNGLDTEIEENGKNLSFGQCQLICLIRALLPDTDILLLDEATAGLDPETERFLQDVFTRTFKSKTVLFIAHRPESTQICDRIITIENGVVAAIDGNKGLVL